MHDLFRGGGEISELPGTKVEIEVRGRSLTNKKLERIRMYFLLSMCSIHTNVVGVECCI